MDENKDILTSEQDAEKEVNSDEEIQNQETESQDEVLKNNEPEISDSDEESAEVKPIKKKRLIQTPVIIAIAIVAAAVICLLVYKCFFDASIVGVWSEAAAPSNATADEAEMLEQYYVFESDGKLKLKTGTMTWVYDYTTGTNDSGEKQITVSMNNGGETVFTYDVKGNIFTGRVLTMTNSYNEASFELGNTTVKEHTLDVAKDFKPNDKLVGTWTYNNGINKMSYNFKDDGTVVISQDDMLFVDGVYTYTDDQIKVTYYADSEANMDLVYSVEDNGLKINDILFEKDNGEKDKVETTEASTAK